MNTRPRLRQRNIVFFMSILLSTAQAAPILATQKDSSTSHPASGSTNGKFELTIDNIMSGPALVGNEPRAVHWSPDSQHIYFQWKQAGEPREKDFDTYIVNRDAAGFKKLTQEEARNAAPIPDTSSHGHSRSGLVPVAYRCNFA